MGQQIHWQYALIWAPEAKQPTFTIYRHSSAGHRFTWASVPAPGFTGTPSVDQVLEELYRAVLALMEQTA